MQFEFVLEKIPSTVILFFAASIHYSLSPVPLQIDEVALVTDKVTKKRRGFIFVTYMSEDSVDKCTEQTFHTVKDTQVSPKHPMGTSLD